MRVWPDNCSYPQTNNGKSIRLIPCFLYSRVLFLMGPQREDNRLVLSDMTAKKSELFPQILHILCYECFIGNLLASHSIYWRNKVNVCIKYYEVMISFIKSKLWFQANVCRYNNTRLGAWVSVHPYTLTDTGLYTWWRPEELTCSPGYRKQCLSRPVLRAL